MKNFAILIGLALALFAGGCSSSDEAQRVLTKQGYTNIKTTGYSFFGCDARDTFKTGFEATAPNGAEVEGVVCSGWFKGATVRITD